MANYLANSHGQCLAQHSFLVGQLAAQIVQDRYGSSRYSRGINGEAAVATMTQQASLSGYLHDPGKLPPPFQDYLRARATPVDLSEDGTHISEAYAKEFSFNFYPRHEEISLALIRRFLKKDLIQDALGEDPGTELHESKYASVEHAVYWHHAKPNRDYEYREQFNSTDKIIAKLDRDWVITEAPVAFLDLLQQIDTLISASAHPAPPDYKLASFIDRGRGDEALTPKFKLMYDRPELSADPAKLGASLMNEMMRTAVRSAVVSADRCVSRLTALQLNNHVTNNTLPNYNDTRPQLPELYSQIDAMTKRFSVKYPGARTEEQAVTAYNLAHPKSPSNIVCLQGPAGCGKTSIALQYLRQLGSEKRIFIFVPRTAIGESLFNELTAQGPDADYGITCNVEFFSGGKKLFCKTDGLPFDTPDELQGEGDIIITTIDQMCKTMLSHHKIDLITHMADSHVIFDEFHELMDLPGILLLFLEMMELRKFSTAGTLLVSATHNPFLLKQIEIDPRCIVQVETFNKNLFTLNLQDDWNPAIYSGKSRAPHPFYSGELTFEPGSFVVANTATVAQQASLANHAKARDVICFHSKFTPKDKSLIFNKLLGLYGKGSPPTDCILISGPIVQASLNITTENLHIELDTAENTLQRVGRCNRFGELPHSVVTIYCALNAKATLACDHLLSTMNRLARANIWHKFLRAKLKKGSMELTLGEYYQFYNEFHELPLVQRAYTADFEQIVRASVAVFKANTFDPTQYSAPSASKTTGQRLAKNSLRGRSYFVLPLKLQFMSGGKSLLSLLWNSESPVEELLTDEMRVREAQHELIEKYRQLAKKSAKPATVPASIRGKAGIPILAAIAKAAARSATWPKFLASALSRDTPILVCKAKLDEDNIYYVEHEGLIVGTMKASALSDVPGVSLRAALT